MLFVSTQPIQVEVLQDRKVIVLTHNKIMFSHLDFIQQYLAMPLINNRPSKMYYQPSVMQTMVISDRAIQVYYTDWRTQIKLIRVLILNNQYVDGVCYEKQTGWHVFGSMAQYEPTRINFHRSIEKDDKIIAKCFVDQNKYVLTHDKLKKREGLTEEKEVWWKDRMMVLRNSNFCVQMSGAPTLDKKKDIICVNSTYILVVSKFQVVNMIVQSNTVYFCNSLLISNSQRKKMTTIQKCENNGFAELGTINRQDGCICAAFLYENDLTMLHYEQKQIHIHSIPLVSQAENNQVGKKVTKKRLFQSISRIMQESHEQGSQLVSFEDKQNAPKLPNVDFSHKTQTQYFPNEKPKIRDIVINDEEIKSNNLNESASQVLSRSGIEGEKNSEGHNSQSQRQNQQQQLSFEMATKNYNSTDLRKDSKFRSVPYKPKKWEMNRSESLKDKKSDRSQKVNRNENNQQIKEQAQSANNVSMQRSEDGKSAGKRSMSKFGRNKKNDSLNLSNQNENNSFEQHAATPAFGFESLGNDKWGSFDRQWNEAAQNEINEQQQEQMQESICIEDEKSILKSVSQKTSKKYQYFKPKNAIYTSQLYNKIEKASYCSLISQALQQNPDKLQQYLDKFLPNILSQPKAHLFFQNNIRTFNPQFTQDKIRTLFKSLPANAENKEKITTSLQLFKISEVPKQLLCFPQDFVKIISIICKQMYIEDLIRPTQNTIDYILSAYFHIQQFQQDVVKIEDEEIDITHPRNMLNILLYLNQFMGLKIEVVVKVYCAKLLEQEHLDILQKIVQKENIFQICEVPRSLLDDVIIDRFNQLLHQSVQNADYLWSILDLLSPPLLNKYRIKLAIVSQFNKCNIIFDIQPILNINTNQSNIDIYLFMQKIFTQNSCRNLIPLKLSSIYRSLYWLQEGERIKYVTFEYVQLVKVLAEKFCEKKMFYYGFALLETVLAKVKTSFVVKMLMAYLDCKFVNRLADKQKYQSLQTVFPQLMSNPDYQCSLIKGDDVKIPQFSDTLSCSWNKFLSIFQKYLTQPIQIKVLVYCQINTAYQLFLTLDQNLKQNFIKFINQIEQNIIIQLDDMNLNDNSLNPKGQTSLLFEDHPKQDLQSMAATSTLNRDDMFLNVQQQRKKQMVYKSMTIIDHFNDLNQQKLLRRNSDKKYSSQSILDNHDDLLRVKLLVNSKEIIDELRDIYNLKDQDIFVKSLKLVDLEKVQLYHLDLFKSIVYKNVEFALIKILPFEIFLEQNTESAFELTKQKISQQINIRNFWIILIISQIMFKRGEQVCKMFINKCISYFRTDIYSSHIKKILQTLEPRIQQQNMQVYLQQAKCYNLKDTYMLLEEYKNKDKNKDKDKDKSKSQSQAL